MNPWTIARTARNLAIQYGRRLGYTRNWEIRRAYLSYRSFWSRLARREAQGADR